MRESAWARFMDGELPKSKLAGERLVWVFSPVDSSNRFPSGVWSTRAAAEKWITSVDARGVLSAYVLDESAWNSNVRLGMLKLTEPRRETSEFKRCFTSAVDHYHYEGPQVHSVQLGRDKERRPSQVFDDSGKLKFQCSCCGQFTLDEVDMCDVCSECGWEDWYECLDNPSQAIRPNRISLNDARSLVARFGAGACCEVNWTPGKKPKDIERMPASLRTTLKTARERVSGH